MDILIKARKNSCRWISGLGMDARLDFRFPVLCTDVAINEDKIRRMLLECSSPRMEVSDKNLFSSMNSRVCVPPPLFTAE